MDFPHLIVVNRYFKWRKLLLPKMIFLFGEVSYWSRWTGHPNDLNLGWQNSWYHFKIISFKIGLLVGTEPLTSNHSTDTFLGDILQCVSVMCKVRLSGFLKDLLGRCCLLPQNWHWEQCWSVARTEDGGNLVKCAPTEHLRDPRPFRSAKLRCCRRWAVTAVSQTQMNVS